MRSSPLFDAESVNVGAATAPVRAMLSEWQRIDWFVPPPPSALIDAKAVSLFQAHHAQALALRPDLFAEAVTVKVQRGTWADFHAHARHVRAGNRSYDWRYGALKLLVRAHSKERGWSLQTTPFAPPDPSPGEGSLVFRLADRVMWNTPMPKLNAAEFPSAEDADVASWYASYAASDLIDAIEWQLADDSADTASNPFVPLAKCYGTGFYPFAVSATDVTLFGTTTVMVDEAVLVTSCVLVAVTTSLPPVDGAV